MIRKTLGTDGEGRTVAIGSTDRHGYRVGFIDRDGLAWQSRAERDGAVASGRYVEAALAYQHGERRTRPRRILFALRHGPLTLRSTLREIDEAVEFQRRFGQGRGRLGPGA